MKYAYYPGCSMKSSAQEYDVSTRLVLERLGCEMQELEDWTCCGASAAEAVSELLQLALPARNVALAASTMPDADILAPCSACYLNLLRVAKLCDEDSQTQARINEALSDEMAPDGQALQVPKGMRVRHLMDVLFQDVGLERIKEAVTRPLEGLVIAPYYGCQILRPYHVFDDPERPQTMHQVLEALGATVLEWNFANKCCGASLMAYKKATALSAVRAILKAASEADAVVTVCPLCHMNLEAYQDEALQGGGHAQVDVLYLPQLMGLAFGLTSEELKLQANMAATACVGKIVSGLEAPEKAAP